MILWLDEQLSPFLAKWIASSFSVECESVVNLPVNRGSDPEIFQAARSMGATIVSKDSDFVDLVRRLGPPPQLVWLSCGNRSNHEMKRLLSMKLGEALGVLADGEPIVEIA